MSALTSRLSLTKPGGGSHGTILPPDPVDIDVLNDNFDKIDGAVGGSNVTSTSRPPTPFIGQLIREADTRAFKFWDGSQWQDIGPGVWTDTSVVTYTGFSGMATLYCKHRIQAGRYEFEWAMQMSSGAALNDPKFTPPVSPAGWQQNASIGSGYSSATVGTIDLIHNPTGTAARYNGVVVWQAGQARAQYGNPQTAVTNTAPATWAGAGTLAAPSGDIFIWHLSFPI